MFFKVCAVLYIGSYISGGESCSFFRCRPAAPRGDRCISLRITFVTFISLQRVGVQRDREPRSICVSLRCFDSGRVRADFRWARSGRDLSPVGCVVLFFFGLGKGLSGMGYTGVWSFFFHSSPAGDYVMVRMGNFFEKDFGN